MVLCSRAFIVPTLTAARQGFSQRTQSFVLHASNFALFAYIEPAGALAKEGFEFCG